LTKDTPNSKVSEAVLEYLTAATEGVPQVGLAKLSSKNQITLPVAAVRQLGLRPGDRLTVRLEDGRIILKPRPKDWVQHYRGRLRGVYGASVEEIDAYVREERESWQNREEKLDS
jgi:AbrB family looped-hinge helix DNA binding protein